MMKTLSVKAKSLIIAIVAAVFGMALVMTLCGRPTVAAAETVIESADDVFELTGTSFDADEQFVFSATANFERGDAAGLVFGAGEGKYWVFNVDRANNLVKLMYFDCSSGETKVSVLDEEYYVGPSIMNEGEKRYVKGRTAAIDKVYLKVAITPTDTGVIGAFYADGIRRFAYTDGCEEAVDIDLNSLSVGTGVDETLLEYKGGGIGYNCFNARVRFTDEVVGETDFANYAELYRNQYHFSQYAHWNNDPNGLVYYKGYYHMYFQHNPYGNTWDDMHWGHARSKDLVHWELLPIALVPDYDLPEGDFKLLGAMWSGSARVYHVGDSAVIDNDYGWFDETGCSEGDAVGLIGFYSWWNGNGGNRYQVVMYSTDGGLTWNKRDNIRNSTSLNPDGNPVTDGSWRDPKVFDISTLPGIDGNKWGMALTNMEGNALYFLKSEDLVHWTHAGSYEVYRPECPDVVTVGGRTVITFTSRYYVVCDLKYEGGNIVMYDGITPITSLMQGDPHFRTMDYGVDSYACQTFYIDQASDSAYKGKNVSISWFSGVPNAAASIESGVLMSARKVWNGGGMTIPVVYGLDGDTLTTTPITVNDPAFGALKTTLVDVDYVSQDAVALDDIHSKHLEITANISNPSRREVSFKVNRSADGTHYTEVGWNSTEGYFVDRRFTEDAGINFPQPNYAVRYASGMGKTNSVLDFYILVDDNNVEVYCDGFTVPFYILTFAAPHSDGVELCSAGMLTLNKLTVNEIGTVWRGESEDSLIYLSETEVELGVELTTEKEIVASANGPITWTVLSGSDVVTVTPTVLGIKITAVLPGYAIIEARCGNMARTVNVTVNSGYFNSNLHFTADGVISGDWYVSGMDLVGNQPGGDGFVLAEETAADFVYSATFDLGKGAAAAVVFRATAQNGKLTKYIIANYDNNAHVVKLWSSVRHIDTASFTPANTDSITLAVDVVGTYVKVIINGTPVIHATLNDDEPTSGHFGLNVCATRAKFVSALTAMRDYTYAGGLLEISIGSNSRIDSLINKTAANTLVAPAFYFIGGNNLYLNATYMSLLPETGMYVFTFSGDRFSMDVNVRVDEVPVYTVTSVTIKDGSDASVFIGKRYPEYVKVNGTAIASTDYSVQNYVLRLSKRVLGMGANIVTLSDGTTFSVSVVMENKEIVTIVHPEVELDMTSTLIGLGITAGILLLAAIAFIVVMALRKKGKADIRPFADRTQAIRVRNLGLIAGGVIAGALVLVFAVCCATAPRGFGALLTFLILSVLFVFPYAAQMFWNGKIFKQSTSPLRAMGTPKEIFDIDKSGKKIQHVLRYIGAFFKTLWLFVRILLSSAVALIRAPFLMVGQTYAVMYGEFGHSVVADEPQADARSAPAAE